jgi:hypothetical protein
MPVAGRRIDRPRGRQEGRSGREPGLTGRKAVVPGGSFGIGRAPLAVQG